MRKVRENIRQFFIFCVVGGINTVLDISLYFVLHQIFELPIVLASPIVVIVVMSLSYLMNTYFVFKHPFSLAKYIKFMVLTGIGVLIIQTLISTLFESYAQELISSIGSIQSQETKVFIANSITRISGIVFSLTWNFLFYKLVIFKYVDKKDAKEPAVDTLIRSVE